MIPKLKVHKENNFLVVESEYWQVRHDCSKGGCVDDIRIKYGTNTNLLSDSAGMILQNAAESSVTGAGVTVDEADGNIIVAFHGRLAGIETEFVHEYVYSPWSLKHHLTVTPSNCLRVDRFCAMRIAFSEDFTHYTWGIGEFEKAKPRFMHIVGPHYDDLYGDIPAAPGVLHQDNMRPWSAAVVRRGIEGFQWCGDSRVYQWDGMALRRRYRLARTKHGIEMEMCPVMGGEAVTVSEPVTLGWYWILPNVRRLGRKRLYEVAIQSTPSFPSEELLDAWKSKGVNVVRLHDDIAKTGTNDYWHDGRHPPFDADKMIRLRRLIDAVHHRDMRIIPYFSGHELSPDTPLFAAHADEWASLSRLNGAKRYTPCANAGVYGSLMCPVSGWGEALEANIRAAVDELGFDGFYLDWTDPQPCCNEKHMPAPHNSIDALMSLLERMRRHIPDGIIVSVCASKTMLAHNINVSDQYVTFEEGLRGERTPKTLMAYPMMIDYMGVGVASAVPDVLYGRERIALYRGLVHVALFGFPPYPYVNDHDRCGLGYESWQEEVNDTHGMFAAMHKFAQYDWSQYHFYSVATGVTSVEGGNVATAVYVGDSKGVLVAGNLGLQPAPGTTAYVDLSKTIFGKRQLTIPVPPLTGWEFRLIPFDY